MKKLLTFSIALFLWNVLAAQSLIAVQHEGQSSFFVDIPTAITSAEDGDTLHIPGGIYGGFSLSKSLTLIGVGHHPDSTTATGRTIVAGINFDTGSSNSNIVGIYFSENVSSYGAVTNVKITRCYLSKGLTFNNQWGTKNDWVISENWIGIVPGLPQISIWMSFDNIYRFILSNNIMEGGIEGNNVTINTSQVVNNIFPGSSIVHGNNSIFKNNIFSGNQSEAASYSLWSNNVNAGINNGASLQTNTGQGNYLSNVALSTVFANYSPTNTFYQNDFHLTTNYLGTDGTPVGIYGGLYPWKAGGIPYNPHIQTKNIAPTTNAQGSLNVQIRVAAQDH